MAKQTPYIGYGSIVFTYSLPLFSGLPLVIQLVASFGVAITVIGIGKLALLLQRERDDSTGM